MSTEQDAKPAEQPGGGMRLGGFLKVFLVITPILALCVALASCLAAWQSASAARRSASVAQDSLRFTMGYLRPHEDHDVVARVLKVYPSTVGFSPKLTNGALSFDLALINRGNQTEIIRNAILYYSDTTNAGTGGTGYSWLAPKELNMQLARGDKQVVHLVTDDDMVFTTKLTWLCVGVTAIAPDGQDLRSVWPVVQFNAVKGHGGAIFDYDPQKMATVRIISNEKLAYQRSVLIGE